jgi:carbon storage regulator CsrA
MLVIKRKPGEGVTITGNGTTKITVLATEPNRVKLGFEAIEEIKIHRDEADDRSKEPNRPQ